MPRGDHSQALESLFRRRPVATIDDLRRRLGAASRTTILRALRRAGYFSSYSHAGKYYTLEHIPNFDVQGLWAHTGAHFSKRGTLRKTVVALVTESVAGYAHGELAAILGVRVHNTVRSLVETNEIGRVHLDVAYIYVAADPTIASAQLLRREAMSLATPSATAGYRIEGPPPELDLARVIEVLVAVIHSPKDDARKIAAHLVGRGVEIGLAQVEQVFATYEIGKKTARSRSRRWRR